MSTSLEERIICANHLQRPKTKLMQRQGYGDCTICTPDPVNNPYCKGYIKTRLYDIYIPLKQNYDLPE